MKGEPKRARRRRDLFRMKAKARRLRPDKPDAGRWADYLKVCSCFRCGNPRRYWHELTVQEKRALQVKAATDLGALAT